MAVLHASRSGWFPFCLVAASGLWDGTGFPGPVEVGPGTLYPLGVPLATAMRWYWQAKTWHLAGDIVLSGTQAASPFAFSLPIPVDADIPRAAATQNALACPTPLSYTVAPAILTLYTSSEPILTLGGLYYPCLRLQLAAGGLTVSSYKPDLTHPKAWTAAGSFDGTALPLWFDEDPTYDGTGGTPGDRGPWAQSQAGTATVTISASY